MVHFSISLLWRRKIGREKECKCRFSFILNIVFGKKWHLNPISIVKVNFSSLSLRLYCNIFRECRFSLINRRCIETEFYEADLGLFRTCSLILLWKRVKKKKKEVSRLIYYSYRRRKRGKKTLDTACNLGVYTHFYVLLHAGHGLSAIDFGSPGRSPLAIDDIGLNVTRDRTDTSTSAGSKAVASHNGPPAWNEPKMVWRQLMYVNERHGNAIAEYHGRWQIEVGVLVNAINRLTSFGLVWFSLTNTVSLELDLTWWRRY